MRIHYSLDGTTASDKKIAFEQANYFRLPLFNSTAHRYLRTLFASLVEKYTLFSAKGGSGWQQVGKPNLVEGMQKLNDMPYHMHILNGLFPAMKLLEKFSEENGWFADSRFEDFLQAFVVGFTFHDTNKLVGKELRDAVRENLPQLCEDLQTERFFPDWRSWLAEIQFFALRTEYGDMTYAFKDYGKEVREFDFMNKHLGEFCHLADHFASLTLQDLSSNNEKDKKPLQNTNDLFLNVANYPFGGKQLKDFWNLSWIGVGETICTLLSQKLLNEAQKFVQTGRKQDILLHTRQGFIFLGESIQENERDIIVNGFTEGEDNPVNQTLITFQQASFGFTKTRELLESDLDKIAEAGTSGHRNIKLFALSEIFTTPESNPQKMLEKFLASKSLPWKFIPKSKTEKKSRYVPIGVEDWDTDMDKRLKWELFALEKIKFLRRTAQKATWTKEFEKKIKSLSTYFADNFQDFPNDYSMMTLAALWSVAEEKGDLSERIKQVKSDIQKNFPKEPATDNKAILEEFAKTYLTGNFEPDWNRLFSNSLEVPEKAKMCLFSGILANLTYEDAIAHGVGAVKFSNRTVNTLKSKSHHISPIFLEEIALRNGLDDNKKSDNSACIYFDFGEMLVHIDNRELFDLLATVKEFEYDEREWRITIDERSTTLNLFGIRFADIDQSTKGNFEYVLQTLKLIEKTGFRIYTAGVISPYRLHKEMFVFENCMPYIKTLGWDRIRIDEIQDRLFELNLIKRVAGKRLNSVLNEFSEDPRAIFTAYRLLDSEDLRKDKYLEKDFYDYCFNILKTYHQHRYNMSPMKQLAELAIQMARPQSDSSSQETKIIRSALDVLKRCHKEKRNRETTVGQITGELRQVAKSYPYFEETLAMPFAEGVYDSIYTNQWHRTIPPPSRLRHWVNEFAAWYSREADVYRKIPAIKDGIEALQKAAQPIDCESVLTWLKTSDKNKKGAVDKYEQQYRLAFETHQSIDNQ